MAGEMLRSDVTEESYPLHFAIASALGGTVEPFDQYQGPYVCIGLDFRCGQPPYAFAPLGLGTVRLWLCSEDGVICTVYNEATDKQSDEFWHDDVNSAIEAARALLLTPNPAT